MSEQPTETTSGGGQQQKDTGARAPRTTPKRVRPPTELEVVAPVEKTPYAMMALAVQNNADPAVLQKLLELQEKWDAMQAKKEFTQAMAAFKESVPAVLARDHEADFPTKSGNTHYKYATLDGILNVITGPLSENGLSVSWSSEQTSNNVISVTCHLTHIKGHRESVTLSGPPDDTGSKNRIQMIGSSVRYLQRYTLLAVTGLSTGDEPEDDDGRGAEPPAPERPKPLTPVPPPVFPDPPAPPAPAPKAKAEAPVAPPPNPAADKVRREIANACKTLLARGYGQGLLKTPPEVLGDITDNLWTSTKDIPDEDLEDVRRMCWDRLQKTAPKPPAPPPPPDDDGHLDRDFGGEQP